MASPEFHGFADAPPLTLVVVIINKHSLRNIPST